MCQILQDFKNNEMPVGLEKKVYVLCIFWCYASKKIFEKVRTTQKTQQ